MKKVLIISSSLRTNSNSEILSKAVYEGILSKGNQAEIITLNDKTINFCKGCLSCQKTGKCIISDSMNEINEKIMNAEAIVFSTPVYFYGLSGQLKTLLDRTNPLYIKDYKFRDIYLVYTCADEELANTKPVIDSLNGWVCCFPKCSYKGEFAGLGLTDPKAANKAELIQKAQLFGSKI
ncbi:MAG: flavodoxin family protein [Bacilli bacterium]